LSAAFDQIVDPSEHTIPIRAALLTAVAPLLFGLVAGIVCYLAVGATTGLFFGGVVMAALVVPPLTMTHADGARQAIVVASAVDGIAVAWLFAVADPSVSLLDFIRAYLLLAAWGVALWGVAVALTRVRVAPLFASAITVVLALAWLAWPIWLSPWLAGRETLVAWLVAAHPLFGLDGALRHLGPPWTEHHYMYTQLSVLNQDVFYSLPGGVGGATLLHAGVGLLGLLPYRRLLARQRDARSEI
jgi:hypothetical protein